MWLSLLGVRVLLLQFVHASYHCNLKRSMKQRNLCLCLSLLSSLVATIWIQLQFKPLHFATIFFTPYCSIFLQPDECRTHAESCPFYFSRGSKSCNAYNCLFLFFHLRSRVLCREETSYKPHDIGRKKYVLCLQEGTEIFKLHTQFANAAKSYAAKRKSNEKSSQITVFPYFESVHSS